MHYIVSLFATKNITYEEIFLRNEYLLKVDLILFAMKNKDAETINFTANSLH